MKEAPVEPPAGESDPEIPAAFVVFAVSVVSAVGVVSPFVGALVTTPPVSPDREVREVPVVGPLPASAIDLTTVAGLDTAVTWALPGLLARGACAAAATVLTTAGFVARPLAAVPFGSITVPASPVAEAFAPDVGVGEPGVGLAVGTDVVAAIPEAAGRGSVVPATDPFADGSWEPVVLGGPSGAVVFEPADAAKAGTFSESTPELVAVGDVTG